MNDVRELIIIGGGPAGYTAALYAARANLEPLVIEGFQWGGQLMITSDVENYPGYADGVMGPEMMAEFRRQAERFGTEFVTDDVTRVDFSERPFRVWVEDDEYRAKTVIVATGASARWLGLAGEQRLPGPRRLRLRDLRRRLLPDKELIVVGGGDTAMEEATFLTRFATKVTVVHRRDEFRASQIMLDRARANEKIEFITNAVVEDILGDGKVESVTLRDTQTGEHLGARRSAASSSRSATTRTRSSSSTSSTTTTTATCHEAGLDRDEHPRRLRRRRRAGPHLPPGGHRGRLRLYGRARRRALPRRSRRGTTAPALTAPRPEAAEV